MQQEVRSIKLKNPIDGRRLAISDIHGCYKTFKSLLKKVKISKEDQLFILGDSINRGPNSAKVLNHLIDLKKEGHQVYHLRGNHEHQIITLGKKPSHRTHRLLSWNRSTDLLNKSGKIKPKYLKFLNNTFHYIVLDNYFLVHAGFDFEDVLPFNNPLAMMHIKTFKINKEVLGERKLIIGHTPKPLKEIERRLTKGKKKIYIDNGCINVKEKDQGNLICLDLDQFKITIQKNIEK